MLTLGERAAPSTPATGYVALYPKTDGLLYSKDDAGTETLVSARITLSSTTATTSGTSHDFSVGSGARRWTLMLSGVSISGTASLRVQLAGSGGVENSGYLGASNRAGAASDLTGQNSTAGADSSIGLAGTTDISHGKFVGDLLDASTNTWIITHILGQSNAARASSGAHSKSITGTLTSVRLTTSNGTDTFDAGSASISYEY